MSDNDSNVIKPVDYLQNIAGLGSVRRREKRRRRGDSSGQRGKGDAESGEVQQGREAEGEEVEGRSKSSGRGGEIDFQA